MAFFYSHKYFDAEKALLKVTLFKGFLVWKEVRNV